MCIRDRVLVLHGGRGDLARRLVIPSLATLAHRGLLPAQWALFGTGREVISTQEYQDLVRDSLTEFGQKGIADDDVAAITEHSAFIGEVGEVAATAVQHEHQRSPVRGVRGARGLGELVGLVGAGDHRPTLRRGVRRRPPSGSPASPPGGRRASGPPAPRPEIS